MNETKIISVGIDIGTSTTQIIFSRLTFENTAGFFRIPHVSIVNKEVTYKSEIYRTPLKSAVWIDGDAVRGIVEREYQRAGFRPQDVGSGAVIITGESARKENSAVILEKLSTFAGEFVVATAGPDLEAVIAGKGCGARRYSEEHSCRIVNLDIGGGTTNAALFDCGKTMAKGCLDIGGRQVTVSPDGEITYISKSAGEIAAAKEMNLAVGQRGKERELCCLTDAMAEILEEFLGLRPSGRLLSRIVTRGSSGFHYDKPIQAISFSGGVADFIYHPEKERFPYGDIGVLLGESIRNSRLLQAFQVYEPEETIRATVIGAGNYTTTVSGSTITYSKDLFPMKNIPVLKLSLQEQELCRTGDDQVLREKIGWFLSQSDSRQLILAMEGEQNPSYASIKRWAKAIYGAMDAALAGELPLLLVISHDMAKALGQAIKQIAGGKREIIAIDSVVVEDGDYVDLGRPVMNGMAVPVIVKTLILG